MSETVTVLVKPGLKHGQGSNIKRRGDGPFEISECAYNAFSDKFDLYEEPKEEEPEVIETFDDLPEDAEFPYHKGAGYYWLSNGETVRGEDAAIEAELALEA